MMKRSSCASVLAVFLLLAAGFGGDKHKEPYALLFGTVVDANGRSVSGVVVKIRRASEKKAKWELYSNSTGEFAQRLPAGKMDYVVWVDLKHKADAEKTAVTVHFQNDERQDILLHLSQETK